MILLSHPAVNSYTRNISLALADAGVLDEFCTTLGWGDGGWMMRHLPHEVRRQWSRRQVAQIVAPKVRRHGGREVMRLVAPYLRIGLETKSGLAFLSSDSIYRDLDRYVSRHVNKRSALQAVYCGEDAARDTFAAAKDRGLKCIYDLPIGYWKAARRILDEEAEILPEFAPTLQGHGESLEKLERKEEEAVLADCIVACSPFVAETLRESGFSDTKIRVVPYGAPPAVVRKRCDRREESQRPLRLLFAGSIGHRKGIGYLLKAMAMLRGSNVELTLMGTFVGDRSVFGPYEDLFRHEPSRSHADVLELMREHDVLVLPSLFEGFALVILEAMAQGLAVIVTPNTGAMEVVRNGVDGFIVPIRSAQAIAERIEWMAAHRDSVLQMGRKAAERASTHGWENFRRGILEVAREVTQ